MNTSDFKKILKLLEQDLQKTISDTLPRKAGVLAVNHTRQNFRDGGFRDGGLQPWKPTRRQQSGSKKASDRYGPLLSSRKRLMGATYDVPMKGKVIVRNTVEYAAIHNEGGTVSTHPRITPKLRKMAWARYFKAAGIRRGTSSKTRKKKDASAPPEARMWKAIALSKKSRLNVTAQIPQRRFLGQSKELTEKLQEEAEKELLKVMETRLGSLK
ncbi:phage virion morphogenesis protein [Phocaeicola plebeius]|jgi:phage gpG-like protein|uniref:phage virion morphogenesis protein n=1 Tax=Phocaeicola plebeius TaxID=310297 RepID=UPI00205FC370|nr:MAG TPA: tail morphogenesis protein [Caudoviricetes sp.]